jgi:hypothetical protein
MSENPNEIFQAMTARGFQPDSDMGVPGTSARDTRGPRIAPIRM